MGKTYAIADIHGRLDLLKAAYDRLAGLEPGLIVHLGDYVDRGPQSCQVLEFLMDDGTIPPGFERIVLRGNHEEIMRETLMKPLDPEWWIGNGGGATLISYGHPRHGEYDPGVIPDMHLAWLEALPVMFVDDHRVFVHAWVDSSVPLDKQTTDKMLWTLYPPNASYGHRLTGRHVVHGHHEYENGPRLFRGRTNLDVGAYRTGRLVIGVFDGPGGPVETLDIILP